ncbi:hypothetical protein AN643_02715 [Candidatus Epulonipiscioides saccharophilum]|nr:hypothetical protein AN643_02715 [Epulopiscium sp. SCG-B10WGA-EpuloB]
MVTLNIHDKRPIYVQLIDGIKEQVLKGFLQPGDRICSIRQLASDLSINPNTVARAYAELERQKIIVSSKGRGNFINDQLYFTKKNEDKKIEVKKKLTQLCIDWKFAGYDESEFKEMLNEIYKELEKES